MTTGTAATAPGYLQWYGALGLHQQAAAALIKAGSTRVWIDKIHCRNGHCRAALTDVYLADRGVAIREGGRIVVNSKRADVRCPTCGRMNKIYPAATNWRQ